MKEKTAGIRTPIILCVVFLLAALLSVVGPGRHFASPDSYSATIEELSEKKGGIEKLAGSAAAASAAITLMPGDFGTPIADKLADLSGYFLIILSAIYIEMFLASLGGMLAFNILVPIGFVLLAISMFFPDVLRKIAVRFLALGVILTFLVPVSLKLSNLIEKQYATEIQQTIDAANQDTETLKGTADRSDDDSLWAEFVAQIKGGSNTIVNKVESTLNNFIDAIAVYMVTTCVIPVAVLIFGLWLIKSLFRLEVRIPRRMPALSNRTTKLLRKATATEPRSVVVDVEEDEA